MNSTCNIKPSGDLYLHLLLAALRKNTSQEFLLGKRPMPIIVLLTINWAEELIVPPADLPNLGLLKKRNANIGIMKKNFLRGVLPPSC